MSAWEPPPAEGPGAALVALGSDPFDEPAGLDPFLEGLVALGRAPDSAPEDGARVAPTGRGLRPADAGPDAADTEPAPPPAERERVAELEEAAGFVDRWLGADERRRLASLTDLASRDAGYDRYGFSPAVTRRVFPLFYALYKLYFRVRSEGHERLPASGAAVLAANHGGLLPFDAAMLVTDVLLRGDPPRLLRAVVDRWAGQLPWVNVFYARVGQVVGTRENFADLLADGQWVLVFPEGMDGALKPLSQRYRLQRFRVGFVEQALIAGAPVVPVAVLGPDDQNPVLFDLRGLARRVGLPSLPVTPTFPWLGPLGLAPLPVPYRIVYGEPLAFHERFGPDDAQDARLVRHLASRVRREIQHLMDRHR